MMLIMMMRMTMIVKVMLLGLMMVLVLVVMRNLTKMRIMVGMVMKPCEGYAKELKI